MTGEYAKVTNAVIKKMKRAKQDYKSLLVQYKETKCEMETLNKELIEAYSKIIFLKLEVVQVNAKVERVSSKKLDELLAHQKPFSDRSGLGYTRESSSSIKLSKDMKFVKAKEPMVEITTVEKVKAEKKRNATNQRFFTKPPNQSVVKPKAQWKSLPKSQRGPRTQHFCHHYGIQGHTKQNCHKLWALKNGNYQRPSRQRKDKRNPKQSKGGEAVSKIGDVMRMIDAFTTCLTSFNKRFESQNNSTQSFRDITVNARVVWVKRGTHV